MILVHAWKQPSSQRKEAIDAVLKEYEPVWIAPDSSEKTMKELLDSAGSAASDAAGQSSEAMKNAHEEDESILVYFCGMDQKEIVELYSALEQASCGEILCSMQTPFNEGWTLEALRNELEREAAYMKKRDELAQLLEQADLARMTADADYRSCMLLAASLLKEDELSENMLDKALEVIRSFQ